MTGSSSTTILCLTGATPGTKSSRRERKPNFATPGANGKLLPGEKARLKRARVEAKRAARSVGQGFNAASVVRELEAFVEAEGDIKVNCSRQLSHKQQTKSPKGAQLHRRSLGPGPLDLLCCHAIAACSEVLEM